MTNQPIKRHPGLKELSRDHHHGLLLCWKIRQGLKKGIAPERIKSYADFFFQHDLENHFQEEEAHVFPLLEKENPQVKKALAHHQSLVKLFTQNPDEADLTATLNAIADQLEAHIRFEERELFNEIQQAVPEETLQKLVSKLKTLSEKTEKDNWGDPFW
ncbi:MAG: hemerythrin domain-containing protein [Saprospiraceae bacterium]